MDEFCSNIFTFFTNSPKPASCHIIKKHHKNLAQTGDFSFPIKINAWQRYISQNEINVDNIFLLNRKPPDEGKVLEAKKNALIECSQQWTLAISRLEIYEDMCVVFLKREKCFQTIFNSSVKDYSMNKNPQNPILIKLDGNDYKLTELEYENLTINEFRVKIAKDIAENMMNTWTFSNKSKLNGNSNRQTILLTISGKPPQLPAAMQFIKIGPVLDPETKKLSSQKYSEYLTKRKNDMQLISQHKYGLRVKEQKFFVDLISQLGRAATIIDLAEVKVTSPVVLIGRNPIHNSSKGVAFILYNSARIETLYKKYHDRIENKYYPHCEFIPDNMDWHLLSEENEWKLLFNHVAEFPVAIERFASVISSGQDLGIHLLCQFLYGLVQTFSVYYQRTRILTVSKSNFPFMIEF